jgi:hypothetical protein
MMKAKLADGRVLEFPDGTDPAVIQNTVKKILGQGAQPIIPPLPQPDALQQPTEVPRKSIFWPVSWDKEGYPEFNSDEGLLGMAKRAAQASGDVFTGKLDPYSEEGQQRATEFAAVFSPRGAATRVAGSLFAPKAASKIPTRKELQKASDDGYKQAKALGAEYKGEALQGWASQTINELNANSQLARNYPEVHNILEGLTTLPAGTDPKVSLGVINEMYKELGRLGGNIDPAKAAAANFVQRSLDDFHAGLGPQHMAGGTAAPVQAAAILKEARGNAAAGFRDDKISGVEYASKLRTASAGSGRNSDNQNRARLTSFLLNRKGSRGLSKSEIQAVEDVIIGKPTKNAARYFGNLLGGGGGIMGTAQAGATAALGFGALGPEGLALGLLPPALGAGFRNAASKMTKREITELGKLFRARSPLYAKRTGEPLPPPTGTGEAAMPTSPLLSGPVGPRSSGPQSLLGVGARVPAARGAIMGMVNDRTPPSQRDPYLLRTGR